MSESERTEGRLLLDGRREAEGLEERGKKEYCALVGRERSGLRGKMERRREPEGLYGQDNGKNKKEGRARRDEDRFLECEEREVVGRKGVEERRKTKFSG